MTRASQYGGQQYPLQKLCYLFPKLSAGIPPGRACCLSLGPLRSSRCSVLTFVLRSYGCSYLSQSVNRAKTAAFWLIWANIFCSSDLFFPQCLCSTSHLGQFGCLPVCWLSLCFFYCNKSVVWFNGPVANETEYCD